MTLGCNRRNLYLLLFIQPDIDVFVQNKQQQKAH
jgi:hypothetical protein